MITNISEAMEVNRENTANDTTHTIYRITLKHNADFNFLKTIK